MRYVVEPFHNQKGHLWERAEYAENHSREVAILGGGHFGRWVVIFLEGQKVRNLTQTSPMPKQEFAREDARKLQKSRHIRN